MASNSREADLRCRAACIRSMDDFDTKQLVGGLERSDRIKDLTQRKVEG